ncbi:iron-containing alcohol dehydrogenase [Spirochaeta lutea]|uniref:Uncharacterized protein n=1 Tax=Spirochaeta lutea TaxID=1480694 RepID=A0A098QYM2_9SPIO|nr:iron-containing alcohol dehydrogenase [Spirochaeta lutea]KGE71587.1 hypothetical protein DC28_09910 [Spirochaeta lutea]
MSFSTLELPAGIVFGTDALLSAGPRAAARGNRAVIVTEPAMQTEDHLQRLREILDESGVDSIVYSELPPGVSTVAGEEAASLITASKPQTVIGLGGMRVLAVARYAAEQAFFGRSRGGGSGGRYIEIPTSCRNHFMFRNESVLTDANSGLPRIFPLTRGLVSGVIVDPSLTQSLSNKYFAVALLDILLASIEGYLSEDADFLAEIHLTAAIEKLYQSLSIYVRMADDSRARLRGSEAGMLSALGLGRAGQGPGGALSYVINSRHKVPKSWVSAVLLPHIVDLYQESEAPRVARIAGCLGEDVIGRPVEEVAPLASGALRRILGQLNIPTRLRDLNLSLGDLGEDCAFAMDLPYLKTAPFRLSEAELYELAKSAF